MLQLSGLVFSSTPCCRKYDQMSAEKPRATSSVNGLLPFWEQVSAGPDGLFRRASEPNNSNEDEKRTSTCSEEGIPVEEERSAVENAAATSLVSLPSEESAASQQSSQSGSTGTVQFPSSSYRRQSSRLGKSKLARRGRSMSFLGCLAPQN